MRYVAATVAAALWLSLSVGLTVSWVLQWANWVGLGLSIAVMALIAWVPGFMMIFTAVSVGSDRRRPPPALAQYPPLTVLVACYNEAATIAATLASILEQDYPAPLSVMVIDDGSGDASAAIVRHLIAQGDHSRAIRLLQLGHNRGKAAALNAGLAEVQTEWFVSIDADCWLTAQALRRLMEALATGDAGSRLVAIAGAVFVANPLASWVSRLQEWDYFNGIAAVKRMQDAYGGVLVAQGAFSAYLTQAVREAGGYPHCVGEDIVVTWDLLERGGQVAYAADAVLFTHVPETYRQYARQRQRWSRGLIEALHRHWRLLFRARLGTTFIYWNLLFPLMDVVYTTVFLPGLLLALSGYYWIAGPVTLILIPIALLWNTWMNRLQSAHWQRLGLERRGNWSGFLAYALAYGVVLQPVCVQGYLSELLGLRKSWGTK